MLCIPRRDVRLACPLSRLAALQHCKLISCTKWDSLASLPPSLNSLELCRVGDWRHWSWRLPSQASLNGARDLG